MIAPFHERKPCIYTEIIHANFKDAQLVLVAKNSQKFWLYENAEVSLHYEKMWQSHFRVIIKSQFMEFQRDKYLQKLIHGKENNPF